METETPGNAEAPVQLEGEALVAKVQETLEGLLSKKNLVRDQFLAGNMNPQMYIPIRVLMAHEKLQAIGATEDSLSSAAMKSGKLGIDDAKTMVRPLLKSKRNVIILRDMPEDSTEEEVRAIFVTGPHSDKIKTVKAEVNNAWFVKFDLDEGTQDVVLWLRSQKFKGVQVNASIKSEHFLRSFFPIKVPGGAPGPPQMGMPPWMEGGGDFGMAMEAMGFNPADFEAMKGKGKGMMMPPDMGPLGYWQPWGVRAPLPPIKLPDLKPDPAAAGSAEGEKPKWEKKSWNNDSGDSGWKKPSWNSWGDSGGWQADRGKGKGDKGDKGKGKGKGGDEKGEKGDKGGKGKGKQAKEGKEGKDGKGGKESKEGKGAKSKGSKGDAEVEKPAKAKGGRAEKSTESGSGGTKKWKVVEAKGSDEVQP